jgi:hypothetical protein
VFEHLWWSAKTITGAFFLFFYHHAILLLILFDPVDRAAPSLGGAGFIGSTKGGASVIEV